MHPNCSREPHVRPPPQAGEEKTLLLAWDNWCSVISKRSPKSPRILFIGFPTLLPQLNISKVDTNLPVTCLSDKEGLNISHDPTAHFKNTPRHKTTSIYTHTNHPSPPPPNTHAYRKPKQHLGKLLLLRVNAFPKISPSPDLGGPSRDGLTLLSNPQKTSQVSPSLTSPLLFPSLSILTFTLSPSPKL